MGRFHHEISNSEKSAERIWPVDMAMCDFYRGLLSLSYRRHRDRGSLEQTTRDIATGGIRENEESDGVDQRSNAHCNQNAGDTDTRKCVEQGKLSASLRSGDVCLSGR